MLYLVVKRYLCVLLLLLAPISIGAQSVAQKIADADWFHRPVGKGVTWKYYHFDHLFTGPQNLSIIEADLNEPGVKLALANRRDSLARTSVLMQVDLSGVAAGINGTFYRPGGHATYVRVNSNEIPPADTWSNWGYQGGLAFNRNTNAAAVLPRPINSGGAGGAFANWRSINNQYTDVMVNGPLLVRNGQLAEAQYGSVTTHCTARHPRTMVGMKPGNILVLVTADGRHAGRSIGMTCEEMAHVMHALGTTTAFSLDGGGSTAMYARGEPNAGIVTFPADNGTWDHAGERLVTNGIGVIAPQPDPLPFDARTQVTAVPGRLEKGQVGTVSVRLTNIGELPWNNQRISLTTARPAFSPSRFHVPQSWHNDHTPWRLPANTTVNPGQSISATFQVTGPALPATGDVSEYFQLTLDDTSRFGPSDERLPISLVVSGDSDDIIIETRAGGHNVVWYSDQGMADSNVPVAVPGATPSLGVRYGSTFRSVAGAKSASYRPNFPERGHYRVHVAWPAANLRRSPITYKIRHRDGVEVYQIDQTQNADQWIMLDTTAFEFDEGQNDQGVEISNENIDLSGNMYAGPVWFENVPEANVENWELY